MNAHALYAFVVSMTIPARVPLIFSCVIESSLSCQLMMLFECYNSILSVLTLLMNGPVLVHIAERHSHAFYRQADLAVSS